MKAGYSKGHYIILYCSHDIIIGGVRHAAVTVYYRYVYMS